MGRFEDGGSFDAPGIVFPLRTFLLVAVPLTLAAAAVILTLPREPPPPGLAWSDETRREVQSLVGARYVDTMTPAREEELFDAAMKGYASDLDPYTRYFTAKERGTLEEDTTGRFDGIGVRVEPVPGGLLLVAVRRGGPADLAGVLPGETLERVGDVPLTGRERDAQVELIKGPTGSKAELWLRPAKGGELRHVTVTRAKVDLDTVPSVRTIEGPPAVGYLRLSQFSDTTGAEAREALRGVLARSPSAFVLDLRRNLGGVVQAAVDVASLFLPPGTDVCVVRSREGTRAYRTAVKDGFEPLAQPLVVLTDESTASASEILAGALQDHGRAVIVGERTYGKFLMQTIVPLTTRNAMLRLTTARYETPRGRSDQRDLARNRAGGLLPDVRVPLRSQDEQYALAIAFGRQAGPAWKVVEGRAASAADAPDRQLAAALDLLAGRAPPAEPVPPRAE